MLLEREEERPQLVTVSKATTAVNTWWTRDLYIA